MLPTQTPVDPAAILNIINTLNGILATDPQALNALMKYRVPCNDELVNHPTVQVRGKDRTVSLLGILNGILGMNNRGTGFVAANVNDDGIVDSFVMLDNKDEPEVADIESTIDASDANIENEVSEALNDYMGETSPKLENNLKELDMKAGVQEGKTYKRNKDEDSDLKKKDNKEKRDSSKNKKELNESSNKLATLKKELADLEAEKIRCKGWDDFPTARHESMARLAELKKLIDKMEKDDVSESQELDEAPSLQKKKERRVAFFQNNLAKMETFFDKHSEEIQSFISDDEYSPYDISEKIGGLLGDLSSWEYEAEDVDEEISPDTTPMSSIAEAGEDCSTCFYVISKDQNGTLKVEDKATSLEAGMDIKNVLTAEHPTTRFNVFSYDSAKQLVDKIFFTGESPTLYPELFDYSADPVDAQELEEDEGASGFGEISFDSDAQADAFNDHFAALQNGETLYGWGVMPGTKNGPSIEEMNALIPGLDWESAKNDNAFDLKEKIDAAYSPLGIIHDIEGDFYIYQFNDGKFYSAYEHTAEGLMVERLSVGTLAELLDVIKQGDEAADAVEEDDDDEY